MRCILATAGVLGALLLAGTAVAAPPADRPAAAATVPAAAASAPAPGAAVSAAAIAAAPGSSPADQKRLAAIRQYQRDVVNVVALRADPAYLLGAALLTRRFKNQIPELQFKALSARASSAPTAGPATRWVRLGVCKDASDCPNAKAYGYLQQHAAGNAAVWLVALDLAAADHDAKAEQAALAKAAAAQTYDDYFGKALAGVAKALQVLPPLPDTMAGAHGDQPGTADGVRVLIAITGTGSYPRPNLDPVLKWCRADAADAARKRACLKLAHTLQWGSSPVARAAGLRLQGELDPAAQADTRQETRDLAWQVQQYSRLLQRALVDPVLASGWLAHARSGGTELSLILATLRANHVSIQAPAGFAPAPAASAGS